MAFQQAPGHVQGRGDEDGDSLGCVHVWGQRLGKLSSECVNLG